MIAAKLKPCPFCGGPAVHSSAHLSGRFTGTVGCDSCDARIHYNLGYEEKARALWNTRPSSSILAGVPEEQSTARAVIERMNWVKVNEAMLNIIGDPAFDSIHAATQKDFRRATHDLKHAIIAFHALHRESVPRYWAVVFTYPGGNQQTKFYMTAEGASKAATDFATGHKHSARVVPLTGPTLEAAVSDAAGRIGGSEK